MHDGIAGVGLLRLPLLGHREAALRVDASIEAALALTRPRVGVEPGADLRAELGFDRTVVEVHGRFSSGSPRGLRQRAILSLEPQEVAVDAIEHGAIDPEIELARQVPGTGREHGQVGRGEDPRRAAVGPAVVDVAQVVVHQTEPPRVDQDGLDQGFLGSDGAAIVRLDFGTLAQELDEVARGVASQREPGPAAVAAKAVAERCA